jgi:hypothetical protein
MSFEKAARDEATRMPAKYQAPSFMCSALQQSKPTLSWDADDTKRTATTRRDFSKAEIREQDFAAYLASSSGEDDEGEEEYAFGDAVPQKSAGRGGLSSLLEGMRSGGGEAAGGRKRQKKAATDEGFDDDSFGAVAMTKRKQRDLASSEGGSRKKIRQEEEEHRNDAQEAFDDDQGKMSSKQGRLSKKKKAKLAKAAEAEEASKNSAELELLLMADDAVGSTSRKKIDESGKGEGELMPSSQRKKDKRRPAAVAPMMKYDDDEEDCGDFEVDTTDQRFGSIYTMSEFAIDPTDPKFRKTTGTDKMLNEMQKRKDRPTKKTGSSPGLESSQTGLDDDLHRLVSKVKSNTAKCGKGKR